MQKAKQNFFKDRSVYYSSFPIQEQAKKGDWNYQLAAVYMVGILNFTFSEDEVAQEVRHEVQLKDQKCRVFYYIYLEMPNFSKSEGDLESNFDKWMYVLQQLPYLQNRPTEKRRHTCRDQTVARKTLIPTQSLFLPQNRHRQK